MTRGDGGLQDIGAGRFSKLLSALEGCEATADEEIVPAGTILIEQQDGLAALPGARVQPRSLNLHQRNEAVNFGFFRRKLGKDAAKAQRIFAECGAHPVFAGRGGVTFVEDEVDHF